MVDDSDIEGSDKGRDEELSGRKRIDDQLYELHKGVKKGFEDLNGRAEKIRDYWDIYNCNITNRIFYCGKQKVYPAYVHNALNARTTRFTNQIFPNTGRHVECVSSDGTAPNAEVALAEHYIRKSSLRALMPSILTNAQVEGQFNLYVSWQENKRYVTYKAKRPVQINIGGTDIDSDEEVEDIIEEVIVDAYPCVEILSDVDVCVVPTTAESLEEAIAQGGSVTIVRTWSKSKIEHMIDRGEIDKPKGRQLLSEMTKGDKTASEDITKVKLRAAGVYGDGSQKYALVYETWSLMKIDKDTRRLCRTYFGGPDLILSCKRNPYWSDRLPLLSAPLHRMHGSFKGVSPVQSVAGMQYLAVTYTNLAADSALYSMVPIIMSDPDANPRADTMKLAPGAVWLTSPASTQFAQFPQMWKDGFELIGAIKAEIFQTLSVNPSQITQGTRKKQTQAEVAQEQQIDVLTTADVVTVIEETILTPLLQRFIELDHQFRDDDLVVREFGELGRTANMEKIPPIQMGTRYNFRWFGVESARSAQQIQQQMAGLNVLKGIPPNLMPGRKLDFTAAATQFVSNLFGPVIGALTFKDMKSDLSIPPEEENELMDEGHYVEVHPMDDHQQHLASHAKDIQMRGDPTGDKAVHALKHDLALQAQMQAQQAALAPKGLPGAPGGAGPGVAGTPRPGAVPLPPRGGQQPPGMISQDRLQDPSVMPT